MPCQDGFNHRDDFQVRYEDTPETIQQVINLTDRNNYLANCLCALLTELENYPSYDEIISKASSNGNVNIQLFINEHQHADEERLTNQINNLSQHEKILLLKLLTKK